ncbi:hypothetical protein N7532_002241 [Penicillium argentinense]|uniref:Uncharacterized protein n=1 Tax=Penicillium argentinense TaxID=1131581 RepID=A0A9W9G037_9EURO|nr:uncharacterized protein N7532_002241 [Penicillium argentinense]KAJ5109596.1 hypothetical protein N7532_002241 [Penicillium argentinense]
MTSDKQNNGHLAKPFTPTLSAAFHRTNKAPLTPKLASPSPGHPPRRLAQPDQTYSTPSKDNHDSPALPPAFLSANVTPRSGSRTTRRDATFPSPTNSSTAPSPQTPYAQPTVGLGLAAPRRTERSPARGVKPEQSRSLRAKTLTAEGQQASRPNTFTDMAAGGPRFFHASDARSTTSSEVDTSRSKPGSGKMSPAASFIYANGNQEKPSPAEDTHSTVSSAQRRSGGPGSLPRPAPPARPMASPSPRLRSPRPSDTTSPPLPEKQVQFSPHVETGIENVLHRFGSPPNNIPDQLHSPSLALPRHRKSSSIDSSTHGTHDGLKASPIIVSSSFNSETNPPTMSDQIPTLRPRVFSNCSSVSNDPHVPMSMSPNNPHLSMPMSPGKSESPGGEVLNARTERKIMDLEISNSSLLAINRTLEREMRRQNAELRRYRRLSRSGRLSMAPSTRSFSGTALSTTSEIDEGTSEFSSIRSQDDTSDFSDEDSVADENVMDPDSLAEHDAKHRAHDEKKFMLDLAKHQELLVDSQKMNQSLKRCLGWTEELIKEGQRALEYSVHVQDVELGGRVLSPEELGEIGESGRALLSPSTEFSAVFPSNDTSFETFYDPDPATLPLPSSPGGSD